MNTDWEESESPNSYLDIGFALEITSINENRDTTMNQDTLADFASDAFEASGYFDIWHASKSFEEFSEEVGWSRDLWIDPTSTFSYLYALTGTVHGDLLSIDFWSEYTDFNADSWEILRSKIKLSLNHQFVVDEHYDFEKSPQSFYVNDLCIRGSHMLTKEKLSFAISKLRASGDTSASAQEFLSFNLPEIEVINRAPTFVQGHMWAQLLSGCNWTTVEKIISQDSELVFDPESFNWQPPLRENNFYAGRHAVEWFRGVRRSLNFTPWPWQIGSINDDYDPDEDGYYRRQVEQTLARVEPCSEEKIATFAILVFLIAQEGDDYIYLSGRLHEIRDSWISDDLQAFLFQNEALIRECFRAMPEEWKEEDLNFLPEWIGSEGLLAGLPDTGATAQPLDLDFDENLVSQVEAVWPEFIEIASQELPRPETE